MEGIDLNAEISYKFASFRHFEPGEHHITRFCEDNVLLAVFEGVLNFTEDGKEYSIRPGEYHIQKSKSFQKGHIPSESPGYLYVHFGAGLSSTEPKLPLHGSFDTDFFMPMLSRINALENGSASLAEKTGLFLSLLCELYRRGKPLSAAEQIADHISQNYSRDISLAQLCEKFHFSKSHVINIFRKAYGVTPLEYAGQCRLRRAELLLELTTDTAESIALQCGYGDYSLFYKAFRAEKGISPGQWRKNLRHGPREDRI